jgi:hypothetical protein
MAKIVIQHDEDPAIGIVLSPDSWPTAMWWRGTCTQCGTVVYVSTLDEPPFDEAQRHVDSHESAL